MTVEATSANNGMNARATNPVPTIIVGHMFVGSGRKLLASRIISMLGNLRLAVGRGAYLTRPAWLAERGGT